MSIDNKNHGRHWHAAIILCLCGLLVAGSASASFIGTGATPVLGRKCSDSCYFSSGSIKCGRGQTATCSCDATGNFSGACYIGTTRIKAVPDIEISISDQQTKDLDVYLKSLDSLGPKGVEVAEHLSSARTAVLAGDFSSYLSEQDKIHESLRQMDKRTQRLITSKVNVIKDARPVRQP
jgi:hypothetical protein